MEPRKLERGELSRIIIGAVVAATPACEDPPREVSPLESGITATELARQFKSWGIDIHPTDLSARLAVMAKAGRIRRVARGRYEGV